ncbi:hypothetical protein [Microbacterium cremeum]|uniref:hypothetical protein n=1 Tax=Microbacterium cremeum TaxID=2782169 RepID=UPI0018889A27|nr:hypothetical protein [Microbacterium cremeum]
MAPRHVIAASAILLVAAGALVGCTSADSIEEPVSTPTATDAPAEEPADGFSLPHIAACDEVPLEQGESIDGVALGDCMAAAMVAAQTGRHRVDSSDGTSSVVEFSWTPDFAMSVDDGEQEVVIKGDTGWVRLPDAGWIQADASSTDPAVVMATGIVELTRVFSDPRVLSAGIASSPTWTVVGEEPLPVDDAAANAAWLLTPDTPTTVLGVSLSDVQLWLRPDHLGAYFVGTGSMAGISVTTSNTFLEWGGEIDISVPED